MSCTIAPRFSRLQCLTALSSFSYKLVAMKLVTPSKEHLEKHYEDLSDKPFYKGLVTCELMLPCFVQGSIEM